MKKRVKRWMALALSTALAVGAPAGSSFAASDSDAALDTSEHVDLTVYLVGDTPETYDDILAKVNEITEREINTTVHVQWLSWAEHDTKYSLLFSGNEDFDMIFTATSWCHYETTVSMGGFLELTEELISTYMPDVYATWPEAAWEQAKIDGKIYMMPANYVEVNPVALGIRTDLMEKYGYEDISTWEDLTGFVKACAADGMYAYTMKENSLLGPWESTTDYNGLSGTPNEAGMIFYNYMETDNTELMSIFDWDGFREYCYTAKELADAGAVPGDALSSTEERQTGLNNGKAALVVWNTGTVQNFANAVNAEHPEYAVQIFDLWRDGTYPSTMYINGGMGINANSKNIERTLMLLNLMATNQDIMDLTALGIEGVNWQENEDGSYTKLEEYIPSNWWGWRNQDLIRIYDDPSSTEVDKKYNELTYGRYLENTRPEHVLASFNFDNTSVSTQVAAVEAALDTYWYPLICGLVDDVDTSLEQFEAAMNAAGFEDIMEEAQRQVDEYVASK